MSTYTTIKDLEDRLPWLGPITATSKPTDTIVQSWIDRAEAWLDAVLQAAECPAPYTAGTAQAKILMEIVLDYVEGRVRQARDATSLDTPNDDGIELIQGFKDVLNDIRANGPYWAQMLGAGSAPAASILVSSHATDHPDGYTIAAGDFKPVFVKPRGGGFGDSQL